MKVNNNISAVMTNNQLLRNENSLAAVMERLSSGFKINHAKDNPSGMAISAKMQAQIDGLDQASMNASNGQSVLETADGALKEVTDMLQRMRELSVQAANGLNAQSELDSIQLEIESLKSEINRVSASTEFNTKNLLDGSLDARVYSSDATRIQTSDAVSAGTYSFTVAATATVGELASTKTFNDIYTNYQATINDTNAGTVKVNGSEVEIKPGMTKEELYEALRYGAEKGEAKISAKDSTNPFAISSAFYGSDASVEFSASNNDLETLFGISSGTSAQGKDAEVTLATSAFDAQTTVKTEGNKVTFTSTGGFEMSMLLNEDAATNNATHPQPISVEVTDIGPMALQIGSNEGQIMNVRIGSIDIDNMYLDTLDVSTVNGAKRGLGQLDYAIEKVSRIRAAIGAYENRLDHTVNSLDQTSENMNSAISRIQDADMATEMVDYTRYNVLQQTATSALSQANELPQMALQLLQ